MRGLDAPAVMEQVGKAIGLGHAGDRTGARALLVAAWADIGGTDGDAFVRLAIAHSMADVQDDPQDELHWDRLALDAAESLTDRHLRDNGTTLAQLRPSLHLNLADVCERLGLDDEARDHLDRGRAAIASLDADGYREMIDEALDRVEARLHRRVP